MKRLICYGFLSVFALVTAPGAVFAQANSPPVKVLEVEQVEPDPATIPPRLLSPEITQTAAADAPWVLVEAHTVPPDVGKALRLMAQPVVEPLGRFQ